MAAITPKANNVTHFSQRVHLSWQREELKANTATGWITSKLNAPKSWVSVAQDLKKLRKQELQEHTQEWSDQDI